MLCVCMYRRTFGLISLLRLLWLCFEVIIYLHLYHYVYTIVCYDNNYNNIIEMNIIMIRTVNIQYFVTVYINILDALVHLLNYKLYVGKK